MQVTFIDMITIPIPDILFFPSLLSTKVLVCSHRELMMLYTSMKYPLSRGNIQACVLASTLFLYNDQMANDVLIM